MATHGPEEEAGVSVPTQDDARERGDGVVKPDGGDPTSVTKRHGPTAAGNDGNDEAGPRIGSERESGRDMRPDAGFLASGSRLDAPPRARQFVTEFIDAYASSVASLASRLDELLHSMRDVPSDELDALVRRESRLFEEFVDERREEFKHALG